MNVQIKVNGLGKVDFFLRHYGWVRDPQIEVADFIGRMGGA